MAAILNITIEQGATFTLDLAVTDESGNIVNLSGYTARLDIKRNVLESTSLLQLTTANSRIIITALTGVVTLILTAAETAAITTWQRGVYDLELVSAGGVVTRLCSGDVVVSAEVTK